MNINIPQSYFSKLMRAVVEFELIEQGDRILIGVSGGKDSIFLTYALAILRERLKKDFAIAAFTVNPQFDPPLDTDAIAAFCKNPPRALALRPVTEECTGITTKGLYWELTNAHISNHTSLAVSNVLARNNSAKVFTVSIEHGVLGVYLCHIE